MQVWDLAKALLDAFDKKIKCYIWDPFFGFNLFIIVFACSSLIGVNVNTVSAFFLFM